MDNNYGINSRSIFYFLSTGNPDHGGGIIINENKFMKLIC